ncbi:MAG: type I secretion C-terminal target domain-containing protein, partial [Bosea sp. (in: a-proteobacteria)]
ATLAYVPAPNVSGDNTITVSAVAIDGSSRGTAAVDTFKVTTTPVADAPTLVVHAAAGPAGSTVALNIAGALADTDGSETLTYRIANVPVGVSFSAGTNLGGNIWSFTAAQMANLDMTLPAGATDFTLNVSAVATDGTNPTPATTTLPLFVDVGTDGANIVGNSLDNNLRGAANNDTLNGGIGNDTLAGGAGNDLYVVDAAGDSVIELAAGGTDTVQTVLASYTLGAEIELLVGTGSAQTLTGNALDNQITATAGSNVLDGAGGNDSLTGGSGTDSLRGGSGSDTLIGGGGNDTLDGGLGVDLLTGGLGADTFSWGAGAISGPDTITDFSVGQNDVLDIDQLLPGYNGIDPIANYVRLFETGGNTELQIDTTGAASFTTSVAILQGVTGLDLNTLRTNGNLVI